MKRLMQSVIAAALMAVSLAVGAGAQDKNDKDKKGAKAVGAILVSATADEAAKDFAKDAKTALEKYTPKKAAPGVMGGSVVELKGSVAYSQRDGSLQMKTAGDWTVIFKGKVAGAGPDAAISVSSVAVGRKIVVFYGKVTRSGKPDG